MEDPDAVTEILNNHDILQTVVLCIREEKMAVAKQVIPEALKGQQAHFNNTTVCAITASVGLIVLPLGDSVLV